MRKLRLTLLVVAMILFTILIYGLILLAETWSPLVTSIIGGFVITALALKTIDDLAKLVKNKKDYWIFNQRREICIKFGKAQNFKIVVDSDPLKTQTVQGYLVLGINVGIDLMVHKCYHPNGVLIKRCWGVCEYTTGQGIDLMGIKAISREIAVMAALKRVERFGEKVLKKALSEAPKINRKEWMQNETHQASEKESLTPEASGLAAEDNQANKEEGISACIKRH